VIRVRYQDHLSPGLHGTAERSAHGTTVYLLPGLTRGQRRAALRRLRQEASRGCGPALPGADLTVALAADRFRVGLRNTAAVVRLHPAGSLLPTALAGLLMALFVLASVSAGIVHLPQAGAAVPFGGAPTVVGVPTLAQAQPGDHDPIAHGAKAVGQRPVSYALVASSGTGTGTHHRKSHAKKAVTVRLCGPLHDGASGDSPAPVTVRGGACRHDPPPAAGNGWVPAPSGLPAGFVATLRVVAGA
jgi:hypothetical protein